MVRPPPHRPLVDVDWLAARLAARLGEQPGSGLVVADARWYLGEPSRGPDEYRAGHIPGAVFLEVESDLSSPGRGPGRHPIPSADDFAAAMSRAGIGDDTTVVAYDDSGGVTASRLWFLLRYFGHDNGLVLDGGISAWREKGNPVSTETPPITTGVRFTADAHPALLVDRPAVDRLRSQPGTLLIDARAAARYRGETEPVDLRPGHIPGAVSAPYVSNLQPDGHTLLPPPSLEERYRALGADTASTVICYCGSGVTACHALLALEIAGIRGALLYEGSYGDWTRSGMPVEKSADS
jgi:thiosulfate/3-mercaptopyruvate sulfurtransferase